MIRHNSHIFEPEVLPHSLSMEGSNDGNVPPPSTSSSPLLHVSLRPRSAIVVQGLPHTGKTTLVNALLGTVPLCPSSMPQTAAAHSSLPKPSFVFRAFGEQAPGYNSGASLEWVRSPHTVEKADWVTSLYPALSEEGGGVLGKVACYAVPEKSNPMSSRSLTETRLREYDRLQQQREHSNRVDELTNERLRPSLVATHDLHVAAPSTAPSGAIMALRQTIDNQLIAAVESDVPTGFVVVDLFPEPSMPQSVSFESNDSASSSVLVEHCTIVESQTLEERPAMHLAHTMVYVVDDADVPLLAELRAMKQRAAGSSSASLRPGVYGTDSRRSALLSSLAAAMTSRGTACRSIVVVNLKRLSTPQDTPNTVSATAVVGTIAHTEGRIDNATTSDDVETDSFDLCEVDEVLPLTTNADEPAPVEGQVLEYSQQEREAARLWISRHWRVPLSDIFLFDVQRALIHRVVDVAQDRLQTDFALLLQQVALQQIKAAEEFELRSRVLSARRERAAAVSRQKSETSLASTRVSCAATVQSTCEELAVTSTNTTTADSNIEQQQLVSDSIRSITAAPSTTVADRLVEVHSTHMPMPLQDGGQSSAVANSRGWLSPEAAARTQNETNLLALLQQQQRDAARRNILATQQALLDTNQRPGEQRYIPVILRPSSQ